MSIQNYSGSLTLGIIGATILASERAVKADISNSNFYITMAVISSVAILAMTYVNACIDGIAFAFGTVAILTAGELARNIHIFKNTLKNLSYVSDGDLMRQWNLNTCDDIENAGAGRHLLIQFAIQSARFPFFHPS